MNHDTDGDALDERYLIDRAEHEAHAEDSHEEPDLDENEEPAADKPEPTLRTLLNDLISEACDAAQDCAGRPDKARWQRFYGMRAEFEHRLDVIGDLFNAILPKLSAVALVEARRVVESLQDEDEMDAPNLLTGGYKLRLIDVAEHAREKMAQLIAGHLDGLPQHEYQFVLITPNAARITLSTFARAQQVGEAIVRDKARS